VAVTNCSNNYGPYQFPEKLIPMMIECALAERRLPVYGDGLNVRDWLYVEDHCRALIEVALHGKPGRYNIGGRCEKTNLEVVGEICRALDVLRPRRSGEPYERLIAFVRDRPGHDRRYSVDCGKIERELGWRPKVAFADGMRDTVRWYLDNRKWVEAIYDGSYRLERQGVSP
jgi:dTDP-glucose 4,6-dehydratase